MSEMRHTISGSDAAEDDEIISRQTVFEAVEKYILLADGDRDHMNQSDLNCNQTMVALHLLRDQHRRIQVLERVIAEDLDPVECSDELNKMIVLEVRALASGGG